VIVVTGLGEILASEHQTNRGCQLPGVSSRCVARWGSRFKMLRDEDGGGVTVRYERRHSSHVQIPADQEIRGSHRAYAMREQAARSSSDVGSAQQ
jgi:hypothetical protein